MKRGTASEYAGFIVRRGQRYYYTPLQLGGEHNDELRVSIPRGDSVAALFHTHTDERAKSFSPTDIDVADSMKLPSYMGHVPTDTLHLYDPHGKLGSRMSVVPDQDPRPGFVAPPSNAQPPQGMLSGAQAQATPAPQPQQGLLSAAQAAPGAPPVGSTSPSAAPAQR